MAMAGCNGTLQQHAQSCAGILAGRLQHEDHDQFPQPSARPQPWAFSTCLTATATAAAGTDGVAAVHLRDLHSGAACVLPVQRRREDARQSEPETEIRHISFSPAGSHIALVCWLEQGSSNDEDMQLRLLSLATGEVTLVASMARWLCVDWAPDGCTLIIQGSSGWLTVDTSGAILHKGAPFNPSSRQAAISWRPDSCGCYACMDGRYVCDISTQNGRVTSVELRGRVCQAAAFLPCAQHGRLWVVLALVQSQGHLGLLALQPCGDLEAISEPGDHPGVGADLLPNDEILTGGACLGLAVSALHVALLCGPSPGWPGHGDVLIFVVSSHHKSLWLSLRTSILVHTPQPAIALSPCSVLLAVVTAKGDTSDRKRSATGQLKPRSGLLHIAYLDTPSSAPRAERVDLPRHPIQPALSVSTALPDN